ncbi:MAG: hypothetical protein IT442_02915 [Phycisphaeraceae bacterium]|nr:hypothetical protein [Phycisphaeraceae bacterium]
MRAMRKVLIGVGVLLAVLVVAGMVVFLSLNHLVKAGVDYGASYALGVPASLDSANISVFGGRVELKGMQISNPEGYDKPYFFTMGQCVTEVSIKSLMGDTVELPLLSLSDITMSLQKKEGKANYQVILDNLAKLQGTAEEPAKEEAPGKKFIVRKLVLKNITVDVDMMPVGGAITRQQVQIPEIELENIGTAGDKGVMLADLSGVVTKAIMAAVVQKGLSLPGDITKELAGGLDKLGGVGELGVKVVGEVGTTVVDVGKQVGQTAGKAVEGAGKAIEGVGKGIGGLFGDKKKEEQPKEEPAQ